MNTLYAALAFLAFVILLAVLSTKETNVTVSQKLTDLSASIANVTALVKSQSDQIAALKVQIDANQAVQAQADADVASLQAQIDALNALTVPPAPPAQ